MIKVIKYISHYKYLIGILLLGLVLRLIGISHGYPYIFNIDEPALVRSALGIRFTFFIDHFDWPHFNFYLHALIYEVFIKARAIIQILSLRTTIEQSLPILWDDPFIFYLLSRITNSFAIVFSAIPLYLASKKIVAEKYALIGILFYILLPFSVFISRYALQEPVQLFLLAWALYFAFKIIETNKVKDFIYFGIFIGLAAGTKYNAVLFGILPLIIYAFDKSNDKKDYFGFIKNLSISGVVSAITFVITTFSLFRYFDVFWSYKPGRGMLWQMSENLRLVPFNEYGAQIGKNISLLYTDLGYIVVFLIVMSFSLCFYFVIKKNKPSAALINLACSCFFIFYILYVSRYDRANSHYLFPLYIFIPIFISQCAYYLSLVSGFLKLRYLKYSVLVGMAILLIDLAILSISSKFKDTAVEQAVGFLKTNYESKKIYVDGEDLEAANSINNLGFKIYEEELDLNSVQMLDIVIATEKELSVDQLVEAKSFSDDNKVIKIYVKN